MVHLPTRTPCDLIRACIHATHTLQPTLSTPPSIPTGRAAGRARHQSEPSKRAGSAEHLRAQRGRGSSNVWWQASAHVFATPAQLRASERETPFFGHFVFSLLNSATCASSDVLLMNVNVRVSISHTNAWAPSHSAGRSSTHARNRTSKHERTCCCSKEPCTTARRERLAGWHGSAAWLAEDERYRASV